MKLEVFMIIEELERRDLAPDFARIREELLKWCVMPEYMNKEARGFDAILPNVANIAEWIHQSNILYTQQEAGEYDYEGEYDYIGYYSIWDYTPLYEWFLYMFNVCPMQTRADEIAIKHGVARCDLTKYDDEISDFMNLIFKWDSRKESLFDLKEKLDECTKNILEKSKSLKA